MAASKLKVPLLITPEWLHSNLSKVVVYDCTWNKLFPQRKHGREEWLEQRIPDSLFFDIDEVADKKTTLPHMLPSPEEFSRKLSEDGVCNDSHVVVYDGNAQLASARVFWTFKVFGHEQVSVLNGGLAAWIARNLPLHGPTSPMRVRDTTLYKAQFKPDLVKTYEDIDEIVDGRGRYTTSQLVDARPKLRFDGTGPEPRPIPSGHMPHALNVPASTVLQQANGEFLEPDKLREVFAKAGVDFQRPVVTTCGSGVTASTLFVALLLSGMHDSDLSVYDGSWTEWAQRSTKIVPVPSPASKNNN